MSSWPVLVFDIESIPDIAGLRALRQSGVDADDASVYASEIAQRKEMGKSDFMPLHLQRILVISCVFRNAEGLRVHSLVDREPDGKSQEGKIIQSFFNTIERHVPQLVSWNGGGFDLPVLHYRGLRHGVVASQYWDMGEDDRDFKWNNYIGRYHLRHLDLMDLLAMYQPRGAAPLDQFAQLLGFPGKIGLEGSQVWQAWQDGNIAQIRGYCEADVANTYLVYLRFQLMRGALAPDKYQQEIDFVRATLGKSTDPHWLEFLELWPA